jgi:hypothetical protein
MSRKLKAQRPGHYFLDAVHCSRAHGASPENYYVLRFWQITEEQRASYLTSGRSKALDAKLNRNATKEDKLIIGQKQLFDKAFAVKRKFLYAPDCSFVDFLAFTNENKEFIIKPTCGTMGKGIEKITVANCKNLQQSFEEYRQRKLLIEQVIVQHPDLNAINPDCVNTVRINAARAFDGSVRLIGACLKCGGAGAVTDNFHSGGVAYPIDMESGKISGAGRNNVDIKDYLRHPGTDFYMPGFQVPYWPEIKDCVKQGMERVPSLGYIGWDIAVSPDGPELIEGNFNWPGGNIIQFDGVGKYPALLECLGEEI